MNQARHVWGDSNTSPLVVTADTQTQGRGRYERTWVSPPGNFYSTLAFPLENTQEAPFLTYVCVLAVRDALQKLLPAECSFTFKWPNDLLLNHKKVAGILLELDEIHGQMVLLIGCGINRISHPLETSYPATNITQEVGTCPNTDQILAAYLTSFDLWYGIFQDQGFEPIRHAWLENRDCLTDTMLVKTYRGGLETIHNGSFHDLSPEGHLMLKEQGSDEIISIRSGDALSLKNTDFTINPLDKS
jgi:BirA family biotin operon repressor/biotin-[acetyl-CoA-carboxylase] ligase